MNSEALALTQDLNLLIDRLHNAALLLACEKDNSRLDREATLNLLEEAAIALEFIDGYKEKEDPKSKNQGR